MAGFHEVDRAPYLLDITTDLEIPAYAAIAPRNDGSDPLFSAAAHICPATAARKALKELAQIHVWNEVAFAHREFRKWVSTTNTNDSVYRWLRPSGRIASASTTTSNTTDQIAICQSRLATAGIEAYWIDLTRPEVNLPVVRVMAPGLRHPWARFGPGRLYDVPVSLGYRQEPLSENDLNPDFCFL